MEVQYLTEAIIEDIPNRSGYEDKKIKKIHKYRKEFLRKMVRKIKVQSLGTTSI
jgi:hypothetical protein